MADGKIHTVVTIGATGGLLAGYTLAYLTNDPISVIVTVGGSLVGIFISPDQDVDNGNISDYHIRKLFKVDFLWAVFWRAYRLSFKHRGFWSHGPGISTMIRLLYLLLPPIAILFKDQDTDWLTVILWAVVAQISSLPLIWLLLTYTDYFWQYGGFFFVGLLLSDLLHLVFDYV